MDSLWKPEFGRFSLKRRYPSEALRYGITCGTGGSTFSSDCGRVSCKAGRKVKELLADAQVEESRIAAEVILFADKICTDEEVVRLKSHIAHMRNTLEESEGIGRKLDFIAQEMNREANTILSKANDLEVSNYAIGLKTEIEKSENRYKILNNQEIKEKF